MKDAAKTLINIIESTVEDQHLAQYGNRAIYAGDSAHARHETFGEKLDVEGAVPLTRSEERRVGKECRSRWSPYH